MLTRNGLDSGIPVKNPEDIAADVAAEKNRLAVNLTVASF